MPYGPATRCPLRSGADHLRSQKKESAVLGTILVIVLILILVGALPTWGYSRSWGYGPSGGIGLIVLILIALVLTGRL